MSLVWMLVCVLAVAAPSATDIGLTGTGEPPSLEGVYSLVGKDAGNEYSGVAVVRKIGKDRMLVQIVTATRKEDGIAHGSTSGIATRDGGKLLLAWSAGPAIGLTIYEVAGDVLTGRWIAGTGSGTETLRKIAPLPGTH